MQVYPSQRAHRQFCSGQRGPFFCNIRCDVHMAYLYMDQTDRNHPRQRCHGKWDTLQIMIGVLFLKEGLYVAVCNANE